MDELIANRYRLIEPLGKGGMAEVFIAEQSGPRGFVRQVVLKRLHAHLSEDPSFVRSFEDEARLAALLQHPNIVRTEDFGEHEGRLFMVLEHVQGDQLAQLAKVAHAQDKALPVQLILQVGVDVADALDHAHQLRDAQGSALHIVHRDVSPQNMMVTQVGQGKLLDFGIARASTNQEQTQAGKVKGKVAYFSPEQASGADLDGRCDQFALAIVLYELLTRRRLFMDQNLIATLRRVVRCDVPPLESFRQDLGNEIDYVLRRALSPEPRHRFLDCAAFSEALERCLEANGGRLNSRSYMRWRSDLLEASARGFEQLSRPGNDSKVGNERSTVIVDASASVHDASTIILQTEATAVDLGLQRLSYESSLTQTNIDVPLDTFVGRESEMKTIRSTLNDGKRLITLLGAGGSGKTRLALQFGAQFVDEFQGGVWFCDLSEARDEQDIVEAMARGLSLELSGGDRSMQVGRSILGRESVLLVVDNAEQVAKTASKLLQKWVGMAPSAAFLVTSRARLQIPGEIVVAVDPLALPDAMQLFVDRAQAVAPSFEVSEQNEALIKEIVERLDCMSLAVELAAARVRMMSPEMIHERLAQRFKLLRGQRSDHSERQATLLNAVEWSWNLLNHAQQSTLSQIAIFHDGLTLEAAEAVVDLSECPGEPWVLDVLGELVDQSLLRHQIDAEGTGRYRLSETIRAFGLAQLGDEAINVKARYVSYFAGAGAFNIPLDYQPNVAVWTQTERENLRAAFEHACHHVMINQALAIGWQRLRILEWEQSQFSPAVRELMEQMLEIVQDDELAAGFILSHIAFRGEDEFVERARSIHDKHPNPHLAFQIAIFTIRRFEFSGELDLAIAAIKSAQQLNLTNAQAVSLLGRELRLYRLTNHFPKALECIDRVAEITSVKTFNYERQRACIYASQGRLLEARSIFKELKSKASEQRMIIQTELCNESAWVEQFFDFSEAERTAQRALRLARRSGTMNAQAQAQIALAMSSMLAGKMEQVTQWVRQALACYENPRGVSYHWTAHQAAALLVGSGELDQALKLLDQAVLFYEGLGDQEYGYALGARAACHALLGDLSAAKSDYAATQSLKVAGSQKVLLLCHGVRVHHALNDLSEAHSCAQQAAQRAQALGCERGTALFEFIERLVDKLGLDDLAIDQ